jgi:hypothetical protein
MMMAFLISTFVGAAHGQPPLLVSDYPEAFKSNTLIVVGDGFPHGPKGSNSATIDGLSAAWIAVRLAKYYEEPSVVLDTDITRWHERTVDLLDDSHNLIVVGCHWVNVVSYYYLFMMPELVPVYPGNYKGDDPLVWPEFLIRKADGQRLAFWSDVEYKRNDYGLMLAIRDGERNVLILWSYTEYATIAMAKMLENINLASDQGWKLNSEAVLVIWKDAHDDDQVQLDEVTIQPLFERAQETTYSYKQTVPTFTVTATRTVEHILTATATSTYSAVSPWNVVLVLLGVIVAIAVVQVIRRSESAHRHES